MRRKRQSIVATMPAPYAPVEAFRLPRGGYVLRDPVNGAATEPDGVFAHASTALLAARRYRTR